MKILAIDKEIGNVNWNDKQDILKEEALHVHRIYSEGFLREIYFNEDHNAVLILECRNREAAINLLKEFPLVKMGLIKFDFMVLSPYTGYDRLIN